MDCLHSADEPDYRQRRRSRGPPCRVLWMAVSYWLFAMSRVLGGGTAGMVPTSLIIVDAQESRPSVAAFLGTTPGFATPLTRRTGTVTHD